MRIPRNEPLGSDSLEAPERRCILTGENASRDELIRLAISPDGDVLPDALARAPGRGAWIGVDRAALEQALASGKLKGALARAFKGAALAIPADLPQRIEDALRKAVLDRLGLEMRAGKLILGTDRIAEHARGGQPRRVRGRAAAPGQPALGARQLLFHPAYRRRLERGHRRRLFLEGDPRLRSRAAVAEHHRRRAGVLNFALRAPAPSSRRRDRRQSCGADWSP